MKPYLRPSYKVLRNGTWVLVPASPANFEEYKLHTNIKNKKKRKQP